MEPRGIGSLEVSPVGLGCNDFGMRIDESRSTEVVHAALDAGVTRFDTAVGDLAEVDRLSRRGATA